MIRLIDGAFIMQNDEKVRVLQEQFDKSPEQISKLYSEITGQSLNTNESLVHCVTHIRKYLENIIDLMPGHVYWCDKNGVYLGCNKGILNLFNAASKEDFVGKNIYALLPKEMADRVFEDDQRVMESKRMVCFEEEHGIDADGNPAVYLTYKVPLFDHTNEISGLLGISIDITARIKAERQLKIEKEKAEEANRAKTEFIQNMSHDIRTPMNGIIGGSDMLLHLEKDPLKRDFVEAINKSANRLFGFINEIVEFAETESGSMQVQKNNFSIEAVVNKVVDMVIPQLKHQKLELEIDFDKKLPPVLVGDNKRLERIILNLVGNAIKFTHQGKVVIKVNVINHTADLLGIELHVIDTGIGIPEDKLEFIFGKFTRVTGSYEGQYRGTGLGLNIVQQFVKELGGHIQVKSQLGVGSIFTCYLPFEVPAVGQPMEGELPNELPAAAVEHP
jgi:two-component system, OmpR family, aerobic respiration control sensor histidine kinase ArcB